MEIGERLEDKRRKIENVVQVIKNEDRSSGLMNNK